VFRRATIASRRDVHCVGVCRARAYFPTWSARIEAVLRGDRRVTVGRDPIALADVARFDLGGYRATITGPPGAVVSAVPVRGEPTNPTPGPSLVVTLPRGRSARLAAVLEPLG
jgi:hypothetical protein